MSIRCLCLFQIKFFAASPDLVTVCVTPVICRSDDSDKWFLRAFRIRVDIKFCSCQSISSVCIYFLDADHRIFRCIGCIVICRITCDHKRINAVRLHISCEFPALTQIISILLVIDCCLCLSIFISRSDLANCILLIICISLRLIHFKICTCQWFVCFCIGLIDTDFDHASAVFKSNGLQLCCVCARYDLLHLLI